jgi:hypothetical protein
VTTSQQSRTGEFEAWGSGIERHVVPTAAEGWAWLAERVASRDAAAGVTGPSKTAQKLRARARRAPWPGYLQDPASSTVAEFEVRRTAVVAIPRIKRASVVVWDAEGRMTVHPYPTRLAVAR